MEQWDDVFPSYEDSDGIRHCPSIKIREGFLEDLARVVRRYANQLQIRLHHEAYPTEQVALELSKGLKDWEVGLLFSPYPKHLIDALDSADAAIAVAATQLEEYFTEKSEERRQARKDGVDVAVQF